MSLSNRLPMKRLLLGIGGVALAAVAVAAATSDSDAVPLTSAELSAAPTVLPTLLTPGIVTRALDAAAAGRAPTLSAAPAR